MFCTRYSTPQIRLSSRLVIISSTLGGPVSGVMHRERTLALFA